MLFNKINKKVKRYWILFIVFFVISFITLITLSNIIGYFNVIEKNGKLYSNYAVRLLVRDGFEEINLKEFLDFFNNKNSGFLVSVLNEDIENIYKVHGLYNGENSKLKFPLIYGQNISNEEYTSGEPVALVKDTVFDELNSLGKIESSDEKYYIRYCGVQYRITGIFNSKGNIDLGDIYINLYSIINNDNFSSQLYQYAFVYDDNENTKQNIKVLSETYKKVSFEINDISKGKDALLVSLDVNRIYIMGTVLLILVCILTIVNISTYWLEAEKKELGIRKLIGAKKINLITLLLNRYILVALLAIIAGFCCFEVVKGIGVLENLLKIKTSIMIDIFTLMILVIILFLIVLIVLVVPVKEICKLEINKIIRGER